MAPVWVVDTSSLIQIKSSVPNEVRARTFAALTRLANDGRLLFPREVLTELKRDLANQRRPDAPCEWAMSAEPKACGIAPTLKGVKEVLAKVPDILDPQK